MPEHALPARPAAPALLRGEGVTYTRAALAVLAVTVAGTALEAYSVGPIPIQWVAQLLVIGAAAALSLHHLYRVPGMGVFAALLAWVLMVTLASAALGDFAARMPPMASTPYPVFIALRLFVVLSFSATVALVYWLLVRGRSADVVRWTVWIGTAAGVMALYVYVAQLYGWWEPTRNRSGTGGGGQATVFTYAFHRAMGTFREPSHLAEWLVAPFFLSFVHPARIRYAPTLVMGLALLLTGSLTGISGTVLGLLGAVVLTNPFRGAKLRLLLQVGLALALGLLVFDRLAVTYGPEKTGLFQVLSDRLEPLLFEGGLTESNRGDVFQYAQSNGLPVTGVGLGNSNIQLSHRMGNPLMVSFLSLYFNYLFSAGVVGLGLLLVFLARPVVGVVRLPGSARDREVIVLLGAYLAWLVMFAVRAEEPSIMFGVVFALLVYEVRRRGAPRAADE